MSKELDELLARIAHYVQLQGAAQMVLDDFRLRRSQTQAEWDKQEELLRSHVQFYEGVIANFQSQYRALDQTGNQSAFDVSDQQTENAAMAYFRASEQYLKQLETEVESPKRETAPRRGAITETVETMLRFAKEPVDIAQLVERLVNDGLKPNRSEAAVAARSTIKNLKKQKKIRAIRPGLYEHLDNQFHDVASLYPVVAS
jgi:hypothetical protein